MHLCVNNSLSSVSKIVMLHGHSDRPHLPLCEAALAQKSLTSILSYVRYGRSNPGPIRLDQLSCCKARATSDVNVTVSAPICSRCHRAHPPRHLIHAPTHHARKEARSLSRGPSKPNKQKKKVRTKQTAFITKSGLSAQCIVLYLSSVRTVKLGVKVGYIVVPLVRTPLPPGLPCFLKRSINTVIDLDSMMTRSVSIRFNKCKLPVGFVSDSYKGTNPIQRS